MKIFLTGYRGSGKSSVGILLANILNIPLVSLDTEIEKAEKSTINEMVSRHGWEYFRQKETDALRKFAETDAIIDCGGGIIEKEENRNLLKQQKWVFFLKTDPEIIKKRLSGKKDRPALTDKDFLSEIEEVLKRRTPLYQSTAKWTVDANGSIEETLYQIRFLLVEKNPF